MRQIILSLYRRLHAALFVIGLIVMFVLSMPFLALAGILRSVAEWVKAAKKSANAGGGSLAAHIVKSIPNWLLKLVWSSIRAVIGRWMGVGVMTAQSLSRQGS